MKRSRLGHASSEQKAKVAQQGCRIPTPDWAEGFDDAGIVIDPAHVTPRPHGGCDHEDCVIGLSRRFHRLYDEGELDILPYLTLAEQAHAVSHLGILGALKRTTGENYQPELREAS